MDKNISKSICFTVYKPEVDLFASGLNHQVHKYIIGGSVPV